MKKFIAGFLTYYVLDKNKYKIEKVLRGWTAKLESKNSGVDLTGFDPIVEYPAYEGMTPVSSEARNEQKYDISNLIVDMISRGAPASDLTRAVRHSMVVIDAEKHNLDYKQSAVDNEISQLKAKYEGKS
jgi:hypothetical protein